MNNGYSSRLIYDEEAYNDKLVERTSPLMYKLDPNQIYNKNQCVSYFGPRSSYMGQGVSTTVGNMVATSQYLTDMESILSNRNMRTSKTKKGEANPDDLSKYKLKHMDTCARARVSLDQQSTRLTEPPSSYRELSINRFYDLPQNPQLPIFYDFAVNTKLQAKDNHVYDLRKIKTTDPTSPVECVDPSKCYYNTGVPICRQQMK